ncbi:metacaspase [Lichtheimia corymbifera JMRC:FSU:9682]|uniref:Metacaspase n=1 Tax=Lichtheimia corymbifera JMRC:FSU:9682 TaxID=1263082 RepID=A0A068RWZ9_9FUNG|nr:metacaspase [Lichtheimia corymbifera JMRC:FSU:9682]
MSFYHNGIPSPYSNDDQGPEDAGIGGMASSANDNDITLSVHPHLQQGDYQLSDCQGRKRALLIGINYIGTENELNGCINDVHNIKDFLITLYGFKEEDMVILTDDQTDPKMTPTRSNIIAAMKWLVDDAQQNDSFFFHFSGHGGSVVDVSGDETDGFDETIYPIDHDQYEGTSGQILDDDMHELMVAPLPAGVRLTAIFDSCHSGTALDLPYVYSTKGVIKDDNLFKAATKGLVSAGLAYAQGDREGAMESIRDLGHQLITTRFKEASNRQSYSSPADVVMFSGCKDDQTSADAQEAGRATGAMSYAFTKTLRENPNQTYQELLNSIRDILSAGYSQRPQLSSSHPLDVESLFVC